LFAHIVRKMRSHLPAILIEGLTTEEMEQFVLKPSVAFCVKQTISLSYTICPRYASFDDYWQLMQAHIAAHGAGSIVLGIAGVQDHWTCVRRITEKSLLLLDSQNLIRLCRRHISIDATPAVHHLHPKDTFLLSV